MLLVVCFVSQTRRRVVGVPSLAERGLGVETHRELLCESSDTWVYGGRITPFFKFGLGCVMTWHCEKSGPAEGVGVRGRSPWVVDVQYHI